MQTQFDTKMKEIVEKQQPVQNFSTINSPPNSQNGPRNPVQCFKCQKMGHKAYQCRSSRPQNFRFRGPQNFPRFSAPQTFYGGYQPSAYQQPYWGRPQVMTQNQPGPSYQPQIAPPQQPRRFLTQTAAQTARARPRTYALVEEVDDPSVEGDVYGLLEMDNGER